MSDEVSPEVLEKTQKSLGKYITKPALTDKLLKKPPFRFLHDVVTAVIRGTGFLNGLYTEAELVSDNVKDRDAKLVFLTKLIDAVRAISKTEVSAKPSKIIAGLDPTETNKLLQAIAISLDKKMSSENYIKELKSGPKTKTASKTNDISKAKKIHKSSTKSDDTTKESTHSKPVGEQKPKADRTKKKDAKQTKVTVEKRGSKNELEKTKKTRKPLDSNRADNSPKAIKVSPKENEQANNDYKDGSEQVSLDSMDKEKNQIGSSKDEQGVMPAPCETDDVPKPKVIRIEEVAGTISRSDRPKSARPQTALSKKENQNIEAGEANHPAVPAKNETSGARPMSSLRPPSVRPSSARPGAPRLRSDAALPLQENIPLGKINVIIENFDSKEAVDEEETVVIRMAEPNSEMQPVTEILDIPADRGHLVEQILEQIHEDDVAEHVRSKTDTDWEQDGFRNRDTAGKEITRLRSLIQALTRVANPLGKLMNYLHEDVEAMHSELNTWVNMKKQIQTEIDKQKRVNKEAGKPLRAHLNELDESIRKQEEEIRAVRFNILRNELRIKEVLTK